MDCTVPKVKDEKYWKRCLYQISAVRRDDYDVHYPLDWWKGKTILDIGADVGSTADFFRRKGAKKIVAVEGNPDFFEVLKAHANEQPGFRPAEITGVNMWVTTPNHIELLIRDFKPDLVKFDCEGCERVFHQVNDKAIKSVEEFVFEVHAAIDGMCLQDRLTPELIDSSVKHSESLRKLYANYFSVKKKLIDCGFEIVHDYPLHGCRGIYARRKE